MSLFNFDLRNARLVLAGGVLVLGGGILGAGCGGGYDTSTVLGFCQALAAADCSSAVVQACYGSNDQTLQTDTDNCIAARSQINRCNPQGLPYHPDYADGCLAAHQNVFSSASIDGPTYASLTSACLPVFNAGRQQGAGCKADSDCDAGNQLVCVLHAGKGTCQVPVPAAGGESCSQPAAQCTDSSGLTDTLYCDVGNHCVAAGAAGDSCKNGAICGNGLRCGNTSVCVSQLSNGQACTADTDCAGGFCLGVSGAGRECTAMLTFAFGGATCAPFRQ